MCRGAVTSNKEGWARCRSEVEVLGCGCVASCENNGCGQDGSVGHDEDGRCDRFTLSVVDESRGQDEIQQMVEKLKLPLVGASRKSTRHGKPPAHVLSDLRHDEAKSGPSRPPDIINQTATIKSISSSSFEPCCRTSNKQQTNLARGIGDVRYLRVALLSQIAKHSRVRWWMPWGPWLYGPKNMSCEATQTRLFLRNEGTGYCPVTRFCPMTLGGKTTADRIYKEIYVFTSPSLCWRKLVVKSARPSPRTGPGMPPRRYGMVCKRNKHLCLQCPEVCSRESSLTFIAIGECCVRFPSPRLKIMIVLRRTRFPVD